MAAGRWRRSGLVLAALLAAGAARAEVGSGGDATTYPCSLELTLAPGLAEAVYQHPRDSGWGAPTVQPALANLGPQAARAYATGLASLFRPGGAAPDLVLEVALVRAGLRLDPKGWQAEVVHGLSLREASGAVLGAWQVEGRALIVGVTPSALVAAFAEAAEAASAQAELDLEGQAGFLRWLDARGGATSAARAALIERRLLAEMGRPPPPPPRPGQLGFLEVGSSLVQGGGAASASFALRAGLSWRHLLLQLTLDRWPTTFVASQPIAWGPSEASADLTAFGLDVAWPHRLGNDVEVHLGAGVHRLSVQGTSTFLPLEGPFAPTHTSFDGSKAALSLLAGTRYTRQLPWWGLRLRAGLEVRRWLGATISLPSMGRDLTAAEWSAALLVGVERGFSPRP